MKSEEAVKEFIKRWTPKTKKVSTFPQHLNYLLSEYFIAKSKVAEMPTELSEPIQDALYATGRFTTDECEVLSEGILLYINEFRNRMTSSEKPNNCTGGEVKPMPDNYSFETGV